MKRLFLYLSAALLTASTLSCRPDRSEALLAQARQATEEAHYQIARQLIDSVRTLYPKRVELFRETRLLLRQVNLAELDRTIAFSDSALVGLEAELETALKGFVFQSEEDGSARGYWVLKSLQHARNTQRCYLQPSVDQNGNFVLNSHYCGGRNLGHTRVKLYADGVFGQTAEVAPDGAFNYAFRDEDTWYETVRFDRQSLGDLPGFLQYHEGRDLQVVLDAKSPYRYALKAAQAAQIVETYRMAGLLHDVIRLRQESQLAKQKREFLLSRQAEEEGTNGLD